MPKNGEQRNVDELTSEQKIDILLEAMIELTNNVSQLVESYKDLVEKYDNLNLPGSDYSVYEN